jgi:NADPH-dependent 2,4-dienoyl-CoA reductase/sulfur reductase-like enzyme
VIARDAATSLGHPTGTALSESSYAGEKDRVVRAHPENNPGIRRKETTLTEYDVAVVGGGVVGSAIAWGLAGAGQKVAVLDEGDAAHRASFAWPARRFG